MNKTIADTLADALRRIDEGISWVNPVTGIAIVSMGTGTIQKIVKEALAAYDAFKGMGGICEVCKGSKVYHEVGAVYPCWMCQQPPLKNQNGE